MRSSRGLFLECLEARIVLAAQPLITEVVASNQQGLRDEDGDRSDWIEIFNPAAEPVDLTGWYLTDNHEQLSKWKFPSVTLAPQRYLVVFASGKDRTNPEAPLHTNFRLAAEGEFLALVRPAGSSVAHQYAPAFPPQRVDTPYGLPQTIVSTTAVGSDSPVKILVPTASAGEDAGGRFWTEVGFDDSTWTRGAGGVGFDRGNDFDQHIGIDVEPGMYQVNSTIYVRFPFRLSDISSTYALVLRMKYDDGYVAYLNGVEIARRNAPDSITHDANATAVHRDDLAVQFEDVDISAHLGLVQEGENILAVQGLNRTARDADLLIAPELVAYRPGTIEPGPGRFFAAPSPGRPNGQVSFGGFVQNVRVSVSRGFYDQPQAVVVASDMPGASIVYTTDGSTPTFGNGIEVSSPGADTGPTATIDVAATTILRVTAVKDDFLPANVETHTYIFLDDVIGQSADGQAPPGWPTRPIKGQRLDYGMDPDVVEDPQFASLIKHALADIPTISLVTDQDNLFDPDTGIYVNGIQARTNNRAWERPTSVELIHPDGGQGFQIDTGLRLRGGFGREGGNPKHAFRLLFRDEYGPTKLRYPLFGDEGVDEFDNIDLRTAQVPSWSYFCQPLGEAPGPNGGCAYHTELRDVFSRDTQRDMGQPYTRSRYYHMYLNGQYWGLYQSEERPEASYAASYFGGAKEDYDVIKVESFPHHIEATDGNLEAWRQLWNEAKSGFESDEAYYRIQGLNVDGSRNPPYPVLLDVDHLIDYMLVIFYTGDLDAPISHFLGNAQTNNWFGIRNRNGEEGFRFFVHDAEWTLLDVNRNRLGPWRAGDTFEQSNPQWIHQQLMQHAEYRLRFADRAHKYLFNGGALTPEASLARLEARADEIDLAIIAESARWGDAQRARPFTKNDWLAAVAHITERFIPRRTEILLDQLNKARLQNRVRAPLYPDVAAPEFSQHGGMVEPGFQLSMTAPGDVVYTLDGSDPRKGAVTASSAIKYTGPVSLSRTTVVSARTLRDGEWSAMNRAVFVIDTPSLRISEIMYHPADPSDEERRAGFVDDDDFEFIELVNTSATVPVDLQGMSLGGGVEFTFPEMRLGPGARVVVARNQDALRLRYGADVVIAGQYGGSADDWRLSNQGETIRLVDALGIVIQEVRYADAWYPPTDGVGFSLEALAVNDPSTWSTSSDWRASYRIGGTPGRPPAIPGDANEDGIFDSADLVRVLQAGKYDDSIMGNSTWGEGDWNGDGEFDRHDLVLALQFGTYRR